MGCSRNPVVAAVKPWQNRTILLHFNDREITIAKVEFVDLEHEDIIVSVLSSNRHYERPRETVFAIRAVRDCRTQLACLHQQVRELPADGL
jgi:hypothetical protein